MANRKAKEENWEIDPRCPTFNKYLLQKWINKEEESGEKMISPKK